MARKANRMDATTLVNGMRDLRVDLKMRAAHRAVAAGARETKKAAQQNVMAKDLVLTGALLESIATMRVKAQANNTYFPYYIGVRHGTKKQEKSQRNPWYWWLWEFGWTDKSGVRRKRPFLIPAMKESQGAAFEAMRKSLVSTVKRAQKEHPK